MALPNHGTHHTLCGGSAEGAPTQKLGIARRWLALLLLATAALLAGCGRTPKASARPHLFLRQIDTVTLEVGWALGSSSSDPARSVGVHHQWVMRTDDSGRTWHRMLQVPPSTTA